jgi:hypothetical protein
MKQFAADARFHPVMQSPVLLSLAALAFTTPLATSRQPDGNGTIAITGELREWHKVTLALDGPFAHERGTAPDTKDWLALIRICR